MPAEPLRPPPAVITWWCSECGRHQADRFRYHLQRPSKACPGTARKLRYLLDTSERTDR